jgi:hypothetical protein
VSCNTISKLEFANTTPVTPPNVKRKINPRVQRMGAEKISCLPCIVLNHLNTLMPVGIAIIIVAAVK